MSAFGIFVSVYTLKFSTEAPALMKHGEIVQDLAVKNHKLKFSYENFRYLRLGHPQLYPWGNIQSYGFGLRLKSLTSYYSNRGTVSCLSADDRICNQGSKIVRLLASVMRK